MMMQGCWLCSARSNMLFCLTSRSGHLYTIRNMNNKNKNKNKSKLFILWTSAHKIKHKELKIKRYSPFSPLFSRSSEWWRGLDSCSGKWWDCSSRSGEQWDCNSFSGDWDDQRGLNSVSTGGSGGWRRVERHEGGATLRPLFSRTRLAL